MVKNTGETNALEILSIAKAKKVKAMEQIVNEDIQSIELNENDEILI
jgi:hypothetical protein